MAVNADTIDKLYDTVLHPRLEALEHHRLELQRNMRKAAALVLGPIAIIFVGSFGGLFLSEGVAEGAFVAGIFLTIIGVVIAGTRYLVPGTTAYLNYQQQFKHQVVAEVFRAVCPTATYDAGRGVPVELFDAAGLFNTRGKYTSDDHVIGTIGDVPFEAAEVQRRYTTGGKNKRTYTVFHGLFLHIDFNKHVRGTTIVEPAAAQSHMLGSHSSLRRVALENPTFADTFTVYSDDDVEARYILTPTMMEQLLALAGRFRCPLFAAFRDHRVYLGLHLNRSLFEPGISSTTSREAVHDMARLFTMAEAIVHELELNTRIWTKDVDRSLLKSERHEAAEDPRISALMANARAGTLTQDEVWAAAKGAADDKRQRG